MNQIYRVIFNHATGVYQCVSEFAKAKGKTKSVKALAVAVGMAMGGQVWAVDYDSGTHTLQTGYGSIIDDSTIEIVNIRNNGTVLQVQNDSNTWFRHATVNVLDGAKIESSNPSYGLVLNNTDMTVKDSTVDIGSMSIDTGLNQGTLDRKNSTLTLDDSTLKISSNLYVNGWFEAMDTPNEGSIMTANRSKIEVGGDFMVANWNKSQRGTLTLNNTEVQAKNFNIARGGGQGKATATDSKINVAEAVWVGSPWFDDSKAELNLEKSSLNSQSLAVGFNQGEAKLDASESNITTNTLMIAQNTGSTATLALNNKSTLTANNHIVVGNGGTGKLTLDDSTVKTGILVVGNDVGGVGELVANKGTLDVTTLSIAGGKNTGTMTATDTVINAQSVFVAGEGATGTLSTTNSTLNINDLQKDSNATKVTTTFDNTTLNIDTPTDPLFAGFKDTDTISLTNNVTFNTAKDTTIDNNARITGTGNFIKDGTGTLSMNVASKAWTGETHINKGVLELNGDYTMRAGEVLAVAVNDGANDYGKLAVKGNADIDKGTLKVKASDLVKSLTTGTTPTGEWKDVVTATSLVGAKNEFATFTVVDKDGNAITNNANIIADYSETGAGKVHLKVEVPVTPPPPTPTPATGDFATATINQGNIVSTPIAQVLDGVVANPTPDNANLGTAVTLGSSGLSEQQHSQAVSELQPLFMGAVNRILHDNQANLDNIVHHHKIDRNSDLWVTGFGSRSSHDHRNSVAGYETDEKGIVIGADKVFDKTRLGVAFAVTDIDSKTTDTIQHELDTRVISGLLYGDYAVNDKTTLTAQASVGKASVDGTRHIKTLADTRAAADYQTDILGASIGASHQIGQDNRHITPFVKLDYQTVKSDAYRETGAGVYNLAVTANTQELITGTMGVNAKAQLSQNLALTGQMAVGLQQGDRSNQIHASFADTPNTSFNTTGHKSTMLVGTAGAGFTYTPSPATKVGLYYQGQWRSNFDNQGVVLGVEKKF